MSKDEFVLVQPVNIIVDGYTLDYGLVDGIYYPYMIMKKLNDGTFKDIVYGGEYKPATSGTRRIRELNGTEEVVFPPVRKVMDIEKTDANMELVYSYARNKGAVSETVLEESSSVLKPYLNRIDYASGKSEIMNSEMFKTVFAFSVNDIYKANLNACFECECSIERRRNK